MDLEKQSRRAMFNAFSIFVANKARCKKRKHLCDDCAIIFLLSSMICIMLSDYKETK